MPYYALTLKKTRGPPREIDYEDYIATMKVKNPSVQVLGCYYEYTHGCHVHMLLFSRQKKGRSDFINEENQRGWSVWLTTVFNLVGWKTYITKDQHDPNTECPEDGAGAQGSDTESTISTTYNSVYDREPTGNYIYSKYGRIV